MRPSRHLPRLALASLVLSLAVPACQSHRTASPPPPRFDSAHEVSAAIDKAPERLDELSTQLDAIVAKLASLQKGSSPKWKARGYFNASEHDRIEHLFLLYLNAHDALIDLAATFAGKHPESLFPGEATKWAAHTIATDAGFLLVSHQAEFLSVFAGDPVATAKLNEAFYRSSIPENSFENIRLSLTSKETARHLQASWVLFERESQSRARQTYAKPHPNIARLLRRVGDDHRRAQQALASLPGNAYPPEIDHTAAGELAREASGTWGGLKYKSRSIVFKGVSRIKNPAIHTLDFSPAQHAEIKSLLEPGDLILTYTAGYMSDVFIPGSFKHGMTYIGSPAQRSAAGIRNHSTDAAPAGALTQPPIADGLQPDVIEAVAEGVIFNSLDHLLDTHVNRLLVLRPKLSRQERSRFVDAVFSFHGDAYDFMFDFGNASRQVCTEVIYRALNGKGGIRFSLTKRGGHPTLSADDIANYHFDTGGEHFELLAYAEAAPSPKANQAVVYTGREAEARVQKQLGRKAR